MDQLSVKHEEQVQEVEQVGKRSSLMCSTPSESLERSMAGGLLKNTNSYMNLPEPGEVAR